MTPLVFRTRMITGTLTLILGLLTLWQSRGLPFGSISNLRPGFFPIIFGSLLTLLSLILLISLFWERFKNKNLEQTPPAKTVTSAESIDNLNAAEAVKAAEEAENDDDTFNLKGVAAMTGVFALFVVLTYLLGYTLASAVCVAAAGFLLGLRRWKILWLGIGTALVTWLVFEKWMGIPLPDGLWF
ncbi:tripartite tricarboxylate transporter TctB family protein [Paenibacillus senegalensis]|uniref:tripartite tricarboxylate transporter TctB family protein n=1 Tax=Paenibacillus senegalensis TaxID=1465766 RepID=UPI000287FC05|nr:tripartite tricarboxylate transporter TctB family protein [Paenibacillus senegalensis]